MNTGVKKLKDGDYVLSEGTGWFEVKGFAIRIHSTDEGVAVDIYNNKEMNDPDNGGTVEAIASAYAFDDELEY